MTVTHVERVNTRNIDRSVDETKKSSEVRRAVTSALIGTALEWYDFYIFATAAALILTAFSFRICHRLQAHLQRSEPTPLAFRSPSAELSSAVLAIFMVAR